MAEHHNLDMHPNPEETLYINDPSLFDPSVAETRQWKHEGCDYELKQPDNIRVYIPLDINKEAIIRRMQVIEGQYGSPDERNEFDYSREVRQVIRQIEIYDQVWNIREGDFSNAENVNRHSRRACSIVKDVVGFLSNLDGDAECFPYDEIDELCKEYGIEAPR